MLSGRPQGGCAIFDNKHIKCTVKHIDANSDRICAILADYNSDSILFVCVYMPCDSKDLDQFNFELGIIQGLIASLSLNYNVCGGDFNTDLSRIPSTQTTVLRNFVVEIIWLVHTSVVIQLIKFSQVQ